MINEYPVGGKLTPTLTLPRQVINDKYADVLDVIYAAPR
jgi:long-subunit acyl-CoA synthetase (AMP-forming)